MKRRPHPPPLSSVHNLLCTPRIRRLSKLSELDDPENTPKKKKKKSDEEEDKSGMDDVFGKLDEL